MRNKKVKTKTGETPLETVEVQGKIGRPAMYSLELADVICDRLAMGESLRAICMDPAMPSYTTVWQWEKRYFEFAENSARARIRGTHHLADECLAIADEQPPASPTTGATDSGYVSWQRNRIDTRMRLIGKWNVKEFGDKLDHSSSDGSMSPTRVIRPNAPAGQ